jgi:hypothetical protein
MEAFGNKNWPSFELPNVTGSIRERIPTMERSLDRYFNQHFESIIVEWNLLQEHDIKRLEKRLDTVTSEIARLTRGEGVIQERVGELEVLVRKLEVLK